MNRRTFFAGLLALPAAVKAVVNPYVYVFAIEKKTMILKSVGDGCTLTRASIRGLSPGEIESLGNAELALQIPSSP